MEIMKDGSSYAVSLVWLDSMMHVRADDKYLNLTLGFRFMGSRELSSKDDSCAAQSNLKVERTHTIMFDLSWGLEKPMP